jgi:hypothetical protein
MGRVAAACSGVLLACLLAVPATAAQTTPIAVFAGASDSTPGVVSTLAAAVAARIAALGGYRAVALTHGAQHPGATAQSIGAGEYLVVSIHTFDDGAEIALIEGFSASDDRPLGPGVRQRLDEDALPAGFDPASLEPLLPRLAQAPPPHAVLVAAQAPATPAPATWRPAPASATPRPTTPPAPPRPAPVPATPRPVASPSVLAAAPRAAEPPRPLPAAAQPCALNTEFLRLHRSILDASQAAAEAGDVATGHGSAPVARRQRTVERDYITVESIASPALDVLEDVPHTLDRAPEGADKDTAFQLSAFYASALREIRDYARAAAIYERTLYGAPGDAAPAQPAFTFDDARKLLAAQSAAIADAAHDLALPEYQYAAACSVGVPASSLKAAPG